MSEEFEFIKQEEELQIIEQLEAPEVKEEQKVRSADLKDEEDLEESTLCFEIVELNGCDNQPVTSTVKKFQCQVCGNVFKTPITLKVHMLFHNKQFECTLCDESFIEPIHLEWHQKFYHGIRKKIFKCDLCHKAFETRCQLKYHRKSHDKTRQKTYKCDRCSGYATDYKNDMRKHLMFHLRLNEKIAAMDNPLKCDVCPVVCTDEEQLRQHKVDAHPKTTRFTCDICHKHLCSRNSLAVHQRTHDKNRAKQFKCHRCNHATDVKRKLRLHLEYHERLDMRFAAMKNPVQCSLCLNFYRDSRSLSDHVTHVHPKEVLECDYCGRLVKGRQRFLRHVKVHVRK